MRPSQSSSLLLASGLLITGCLASEVDESWATSGQTEIQLAEAVDEDEQDAVQFPPRPIVADGDDWIRLVSGEWLAGEVILLDGDTLEFDSNELDDLALDWDSVAEILTERVFTLRFAEARTVVVGIPWVHDKVILIRTPFGERQVRRREIDAMIPGEPRESNYWSGELRIGAALRTGNTDQSDSSVFVSTTRRTASSRLNMSFESLIGQVNGDESVNNQTFKGGHDIYVSHRFFVTPIALELFRDRFQNIDLRATPSVGVGYSFIEDAKTEWNGTLGAGYRRTTFASVEAGESETNETGTAIVGSKYTRDLTSNIEIALTYEAQIAPQDVANTNQEATIILTFDFVWDLDFDLKIVWKRIGQPLANEDGETPEQDDLRFDIGVSWDF